MSSQEYLDEMKQTQANLLHFIDNDENDEENFAQFTKILNNLKICENQHKFKSLLYILANIAQHHHRGRNFFQKIDQMITFLTNSVQKYFSNWEIFFIFKDSPVTILILIEKHIITFNEEIARYVISLKNKYSPEFFKPELKLFLNKKWLQKATYIIDKIKEEIPENFIEARKTGESDSIISELIRNDSVEEFIVYVNENSIDLTMKIEKTIYETNPLLINIMNLNETHPENEGVTLMNYSIFNGSIQIIQYLLSNRIDLHQSMWPYAVHSQNAEIIRLFEDYINIEFDSIKMFKESIKCHHNNIANYILDEYIPPEKLNLENMLERGLKYHNFEFILEHLIIKELFVDCCRYDYYILAADLLKSYHIQVNERNIFIYIFNRVTKLIIF